MCQFLLPLSCDTIFTKATPKKPHLSPSGNFYDNQGVERNGNNAGILVTSFTVKPETSQELERLFTFVCEPNKYQIVCSFLKERISAKDRFLVNFALRINSTAYTVPDTIIV